MKVSQLLLLAVLVLTLGACARGYTPSSVISIGPQHQFYDGGSTFQPAMMDERVGAQEE